MSKVMQRLTLNQQIDNRSIGSLIYFKTIKYASVGKKKIYYICRLTAFQTS